jgi:hypothetical protein
MPAAARVPLIIAARGGRHPPSNFPSLRCPDIESIIAEPWSFPPRVFPPWAAVRLYDQEVIHPWAHLFFPHLWTFLWINCARPAR